MFADPPVLGVSIVDVPIRGRPPNCESLWPIAPYDSDPVRVAQWVFDRVTGNDMEPEQLQSYAKAQCQYHLSSAEIFGNALVSGS